MNQLQLFLPCAAGVEGYLADEVHRLTGLAGDDLLTGRGGVVLRASWRDAMQLNLHSRLAQRVLVIAAAMPACDGGVERARASAIDRIADVMRMLDDRASVLARIALADVPDPIAMPFAPWSQAGHLAAVERARAYIHAGDVFQVVLSQAFEQPRAGLDPLDVYRVLRATNPAPYMYAMQLPSATLVGASPISSPTATRSNGTTRSSFSASWAVSTCASDTRSSESSPTVLARARLAR